MAVRRAPATRITVRELNRATLARQMLLERHRRAPRDAVERLAGLQAQLARPPFIGLWSRLEGFEREDLLRSIREREVVRGPSMRATLHILGTSDFLRFRATLQPALDLGLGVLGKRAGELDLERLVGAGREIFGERPRSFDELRPLLARLAPGEDARAMAYAVRLKVPLIQVPSDGAAWGWDAKAPFALAESWIGAPPSADVALHELVRRYLAAFGPARTADFSAWSGLRGAREMFEELRPELCVLTDEDGRELFDLPDAPRPSADVEAPVRYLPEFDNLILSHHDRARVVPVEHKPRIFSPNLQVPATFLVDGFLAGTWRIERKRGVGSLAVKPFGKLAKGARIALEREGLGLLRFVEPEARSHEVTFETP